MFTIVEGGQVTERENFVKKEVKDDASKCRVLRIIEVVGKEKDDKRVSKVKGGSLISNSTGARGNVFGMLGIVISP